MKDLFRDSSFLLDSIFEFYSFLCCEIVHVKKKTFKTIKYFLRSEKINAETAASRVRIFFSDNQTARATL